MSKQLFTITTLFALSACSTPFEAQDGQDSIEPTIEASSNQMEANLDNADVSSMALPRVSSGLSDTIENIETNAGFVHANLYNYPVDALSVKRVENELQLRIFPQEEVLLKVCTYGTVVDCYEGKTTAIDSIAATEALVELNSVDQPERFIVRFSDGVNSYREMGPFDIPSEENIWEEAISCRAKLNLDYVQYGLINQPEGDFVRFELSTDTPTSTMLCGLDESEDNTCIWEDLTSGRREFAMRVDERSIYPAVIRDENGCSYEVQITP